MANQAPRLFAAQPAILSHTTGLIQFQVIADGLVSLVAIGQLLGLYLILF